MSRFALLLYLYGGVLAFGGSISTLADTTGGQITPWGNLGPANPTPTYGQTFTALPGLDFLTGITIEIASETDPISFQAYVYAWTGSAISGSALFTSTLETVNSSFAVDPFTILTGGIPLADGDQYIVFFSTIGDSGTGDGLWESSFLSSYAGGSFQYNNAANFAGLSSAWDQNGVIGYQSAFDFVFNTPEPSTFLLTLGGAFLITVLLLTRRARLND